MTVFFIFLLVIFLLWYAIIMLRKFLHFQEVNDLFPFTSALANHLIAYLIAILYVDLILRKIILD